MTAVLVTLGIVGCSLMAGLFFAFSTSVMPGLALLPPATGHAAMQRMNRAIMNPVFGLILAGSTLVCGALVVTSLLGDADGRWWVVGGAMAHLVGAIAVTAAVNVPLNNRIDAAAPGSPAGNAAWADFRRRWTPWNHLRAISSTAAVVAFVLYVNMY